MLQFIRSKVTSIFIKVLFGILILSFAVWGIGDIFLGQNDDKTVISVGDIEYNSAEIIKEFERASKAMRLPQEYASIIKPQILDSVIKSMVNNGLFSAESSNMKLLVSDNQLKRWVANAPSFKDQSGQFNPELFRRNLYNADMNETEFFQTLRNEIKRNQLLSAINGSVSPQNSIIETLLRYRYERRTVNVVKISAKAVTTTAKTTGVDLRELFNQTKSAYMAPEYRAATYLYISPKELAKEILIPKEILQEEYNGRKDEFTTPATREIQQFIFETEQTAKSAVIASLRSNKVASIARSLESKVANNKISLLNKIIKSDLTENNERNAAFKTPVGKPSNPVKTAFGWKVFLIKSETSEIVTTFAEASKSIQKSLAHEEALDTIFELTNTFEDALASGSTLEESAKVINIKPKKLEYIDAKGIGKDGKKINNILPGKQFLPTLFATLNKEQSTLVETEEGGYFLLRLDGIIEPRQRSFAEVRDSVNASWQTEQRQKEAMKQAKKLVEESKGGIGLKSAANKLNYKIELTTPFTRAGDGLKHAKYPGDLTTIAFELALNDVGIADGSTEVAIIELIEIKKANIDKKSQEWRALKEELTATMQQDYSDTMLQALKGKHSVSIDRDYINGMLVDTE
jgi:peptidyl-prolyl cis-trans isomerase D